MQLFLGGQPWDTHTASQPPAGDLPQRPTKPAAALVKDLRQRGLFDTTVVHWGGEIGRLPLIANERRHARPRSQRTGLFMWLAGGGFRGGMTYGATDEIGHRAAENIVTPNDYQATLLHQFGIDHQKLLFRQRPRAKSDRQPPGPRRKRDHSHRRRLTAGRRPPHVPRFSSPLTRGAQARAFCLCPYLLASRLPAPLPINPLTSGALQR